LNFILGSGLIGCIARKILGSGWSWIPFKRSRYYTFIPPLADNFIQYDEVAHDFLSKYAIANLIYKRPYSFRGVLSYDNPVAIDEYFDKVYGQYPEYAKKVMKTTCMVYNITARGLYDKLQNELGDDINSSITNYGQDVSIDIRNHTLTTIKDGKKYDYDTIISTIPFDALANKCDININLQSNDVCYYHIATSKINLEGAQQSLIADRDIKFFKVDMTDKNEYLFHTLGPIEDPLGYFGMFIGYNIDILSVYRIDKAIPISSEIPPLDGIKCIGSNAEWDDLIDISTCVRKLLKIRL
jgi:hypothetical protein